MQKICAAFVFFMLFASWSCTEEENTPVLVSTEDILFVGGDKLRVSGRLLTNREVFADDHGSWRYDTVIAHTTSDAGAHAANAESEDLRWVLIEEISQFQLHKGLEAAWPELRLRVLATLTA